MPTYTLEQLREEGPPFAMALLLKAIKNGEPFVTYDTIANELEYQLNIQRIFRVAIGHVAGSLMNKILDIDSDAPLINTMITRANGIPGDGVGSYIAERYNNKKLSKWDEISIKRKIGLGKSFSDGTIESRLLSGDIIDVLFSDGSTFRTIEVKSCKSNDENLKRGIYQCVKYREVKKAEHLPYKIDIESILVTERELNPELKERAKLLGIKYKCVSVNKIA